MRVVLSTYDSRGGVEPLVGLAARLREPGAEVTFCAPPDDPQRFARAGVPPVAVGDSPRALLTGAAPASAGGVPARAARLVAEQFAKLPALVEGADPLLACGILPAVTAARSVAERHGVRYGYAALQPTSLPSPCQPPIARPAPPLDPAVTDNRLLRDRAARDAEALFAAAPGAERARHGLPPVAGVRDYGLTDPPWLATDPLLGPWPEGSGPDVPGIGAVAAGPDELPAALRVACEPQTAAHAAAVRYPDGAGVAAQLLVEELRP
ncbi:glycosyltransferase family 1 protein [Actinoplanes teichomyceticus]|uniref:Uncharacterized protein n=1 Tax=Actinoplanes teichomyceticus TaxID=1867 RepID=A0A561VM11_ACTTI|nr:glycosyltransferase family 1 protein [Actinoplanes teichomyceticus]TWG12627.1 hypothetical protein FHX34_105494 [Actinoplanes teichomyceticus]GIF13997.1 hypothetical protein Ate01nite_40290 [Actinoplanes teichomyceticus]